MSSKTLVAVDPDFIQELQKQFEIAVKDYKKTAEALIQEQRRSRGLELLTLEEAAKYLKVSESLVRYYERRGLPYYKTCTNSRWYRRSEIDEWLESGAVNRHQRKRKLTLFPD
ncbi:helix-turn-helix transcriptional regulator [Arsenicibacter rosenii]|uniref:Helix-turn-helix domain-containing protein n=1 Tax=Arsenicibacter rosenii TaxID=1750698 RepID=A0A1S2VMG7_9BACT|nr:helix-turn-helix domain-containing protein [Arsenicibacter rosenii]OIN59967.1 hypothetical protein BLX24_09020 [Arsenicibacter rosenii]